MKAAVFLSTLALAATVQGEVSLSEPWVIKIDWDTRALEAADIDGDGLTDLSLLNNDEAKVVFLRQLSEGDAAKMREKPASDKGDWEPVWSDAPFMRNNVVTGLTMYDQALGDFNGDGRLDLAVTGKQEPLSIFYAQADGEWSKPVTHEGFEALGWEDTLAVGDLNGDGMADLTVLAANKVLVFHQNSAGDFASPETLMLSGNSPHDLQLPDLNGDGLPDMLYLASDDRFPVRVRLATAQGFGPEMLFPAKIGTRQLASLGTGTEQTFAYVERETRLLREFSLKPAMTDRVKLEDLRPLVYAATEFSGSQATYARADIHGDGYGDLLVGDQSGARIWVYAGLEDGAFAPPEAFPSLASVSSLAAGDFAGEGAASVLVLSKEEGMLGVSRLEENGRLGFPEILELEGEPEAILAADFVGDYRPEALVLEKREGDHYLVLRSGDPAGDWEKVFEMVVVDVRREPEALFPLDINQDGRKDFLLLTAREPARIFIQTPESTFEEAAADSGVRKGMLTNVQPAAIGFGDADGDGVAETLVCARGFIRALRLNADGALEIVDQFNLRTSETQATVPLMLDLIEDGRPELIYFSGNRLEVLTPDDKGVLRFREAVETSELTPLRAEVLQDEAGGIREIRYLGRNRFWRLPLKGEIWTMREESTFETEIEGINHSMVRAAQLDESPAQELICIDGIENVMEILQRGEEGWESALHFTIFEENMHYRGRTGAALEPRELVIADLDGDGHEDLATLVHDRILIYRQKRPE